ncbi:hypothetical protein ACIP6P_32190, partial [Streptomyces sp. NPDC088729]|uniref:hypothetical protein n=1 Tax=Streptomyces sp. NPDC088729 TaxID=3365876 RepID=UPI00380B2024
QPPARPVTTSARPPPDHSHTTNEPEPKAFRIKYNEGITDADIPNYIGLRTKALKYLDGINTTKNPYWEVLAKPMCTQLKKGYPIEAISCQMQVLPDNRPGVPFEPGYHSAIYTIGDIEPLAVPGPTV